MMFKSVNTLDTFCTAVSCGMYLFVMMLLSCSLPMHWTASHPQWTLLSSVLPGMFSVPFIENLVRVFSLTCQLL